MTDHDRDQAEMDARTDQVVEEARRALMPRGEEFMARVTAGLTTMSEQHDNPDVAAAGLLGLVGLAVVCAAHHRAVGAAPEKEGE